MNKSFNFLIIAALLLGVASIFLIIKYVDARVKKASEAAPTKEYTMKPVIVAKEAIVAGDSFTKYNTEIRTMPDEFLPPNVISDLEELTEKIALYSIPVGDMLLTSKVGQPTQLPKASAIIQKGKRLITIPVDDQSAAGYTVKNGDHVDLVGIFNVTPDLIEREEAPIGGSLGVTFLQRVEVFDIIHGSSANAGEAGNQGMTDGAESTEVASAGRLAQGTTATFMVSPQEAEVILAASTVAESIYMMLRRYDDEEITPQPSTLHERIANRMTGELEKAVVETAPVVVPVEEPKKKIVF